ncbi:DHH family phosphoesterase [Vibrio breoganii]
MDKKEIVEIQPTGQKKIHEDDVLDRIFRNRGIQSATELDTSLSLIHSPDSMKDMDNAVEALVDHYNEGSNIVIVGDFDCDGATATTIAVEGLRLLGFEKVDYVIPDRQVHGYGLTPSIVVEAKKKRPDLLITVDCGITSFMGADAVYENDMELIITDHHLPSPDGRIPTCEAAVNINRLDCEFPSKNLAGCGVMFYVIMALRSRMNELGCFEELPKLNSLLDLVSMGTVADLVTLDDNNRRLVAAGLKMVSSGRSRPALHRLLEASPYTSPERVSTQDWGFRVAPVFNAAGRLETMEKGVETLLLNRPSNRDMPWIEMIDQVDSRLQELIGINERRKSIGRDMEEISDILLSEEEVNRGVVLFNSSWHEGVVGILASRVREKVNRPIICMTATHEWNEANDAYLALKEAKASSALINEALKYRGEMLVKGSARSIVGVHLKHILDGIQAQHPEMIPKMGGHGAAAGLSIPYKYLDDFAQEFDLACEKVITPEMIAPVVSVDLFGLPSRCMNIDFAKVLNSYEPWGKGFEKPTFASKFKVVGFRLMGDDDNHVKLKLLPEGGGQTIDAIQFNCIDDPNALPFAVDNIIDVVFQLEINEFRGRQSLQLKMDYFYDEDRQLELKANKQIEVGKHV